MGNRTHSRNTCTILRRWRVSPLAKSDLIDGNHRRVPLRDSPPGRFLIAFSGSLSDSSRPCTYETGVRLCLFDQCCFSRSSD